MGNNNVHEIVQYNHEFAEKLTNFCKPIFENFGFTSFGYNRIYEDGRRIILESNKKWFEFYGKVGFEEKNHGSNSMVQQVANLLNIPHSQGYHLHMLSGKPSNKAHEFLVEIDLWNCMSIYLPLNKGVEIFHLAAPRSNEAVVDICLNQRELIERFIHYFREKIYDINFDKVPSILNESFAALFNQDIKKTNNSSINYWPKNYIDQTEFHKFYLKTHNKFITKREAECLCYLTFGKTGKEIARILKISPRTVESHLNTLKGKLNCITKSELITFGHENNISNLHHFILCAEAQNEKK